jgi:hypothetical protein
MEKWKILVLLVVLLLVLACGEGGQQNPTQPPAPSALEETGPESAATPTPIPTLSVIGSAGPDWEHIKSQAVPFVALPDEFDDPYLQPHSTLGWEDGVFISRDGLHLYTTYIPADIMQFIAHLEEHPICPDIIPFLRGPQFGMDLITNPWGCDHLLHSDIAYAHRTAPAESFDTWQLSNLANNFHFEGAFQALDNQDGPIDAVISVSTDENLSDIFWARGVQHNPPFSSFVPMPDPVNSPRQDDNAHLERLDAQTLVLLLDDHGTGAPSTTIRYTLSWDDGANWSEPQEMGAPINRGPHELHGHLYYDGLDWWLYFVSERDGSLSIYRSKHLKSRGIQTDFDNWAPPELVIAPGVIADGSAIVGGVGEPTLTSTGDISFVAVYADVEKCTPYDKFEIDPWYLPRKP